MSQINVRIQKKPTVLLNQSGFIVRNLSDLVDVDTSNAKDGSLLIYNASQEKFLSSDLLESQDIDGGQF
jgi:hypothetical protein